MNRFGISTAQLLRRRAPTQRPPAVDTYRDRPGHLADAGGAYLVLPYGLRHTLNGDQQQHLVDILTALAAIDRRWVATTTYQVLPWTRIRPGDLSDEELTWHGITSDIDPSTDPIPAPAGTYPGAAGTPARWPWTKHVRSAADKFGGVGVLGCTEVHRTAAPPLPGEGHR